MAWVLTRVFLLSFQSVLFAHLSRECFAMVTPTQLKIQFKDEVGFSPPTLGLLDTTYFFSYAIGLYLCGFIEDKFDPKKVVAIGLGGSGGCLAVLSVMGTGGDTKVAGYLVVFLLNGLCQATVFPGASAMMGTFFTDRGNRGKIFSLWGTSISLGNMLGAVVTGFLQETMHATWQHILLFVAFLLAFAGATLHFCMPQPPTAITESGEMSDFKQGEKTGGLKEVVKVIFVPGYALSSVVLYALCYGFQKMTHQGFSMWLPFFFEDHFHESEETSSLIESSFEVGGLLGCLSLGLLCDTTGYR